MKWYFIVCIAAKSTFLNFLKCPKMFHWSSNKQYLTSLLKEILRQMTKTLGQRH